MKHYILTIKHHLSSEKDRKNLKALLELVTSSKFSIVVSNKIELREATEVENLLVEYLEEKQEDPTIAHIKNKMKELRSLALETNPNDEKFKHLIKEIEEFQKKLNNE